MVNRK